MNRRWPAAALLAAVLVAVGVALSGCGSVSAGGAAVTGAAGCSAGRYELYARPGVATAGQLVTLSSNAPAPIYRAETGNWGLLGTVTSGRKFVPAWNLAAIVTGLPVTRNVPIGSSIALAGVGLPNRPFRVRLPDVAPGQYLIEFGYSIATDAAGQRRKFFTLCAPVVVREPG